MGCGSVIDTRVFLEKEGVYEKSVDCSGGADDCYGAALFNEPQGTSPRWNIFLLSCPHGWLCSYSFGVEDEKSSEELKSLGRRFCFR